MKVKVVLVTGAEFCPFKMRKYNQMAERIAQYVNLSAELESGLIRFGCPKELLEVFDKALWVNLTEDSLARVLTVNEALCLDEFVSSSFMPIGFYQPLALQLKEELGIEFRRSVHMTIVRRKESNWRNLFKD